MNWQPVKTRLTETDTPADRRQLARAWDKLYEEANERLKKRIDELQIPLPDIHPMQDLVLVYRIPNDYKGSIIIPDIAKVGEDNTADAPFSVGVLLLAGAEATGILESHGALPGDLVQFAKYAGESESVARMNAAAGKAIEEGMPADYVERKQKEYRDDIMKKKKLLRFQAGLIHQSVDFLARRFGDKPTMQMVREVNAKNQVIHVIEPVVENIL